MNAFIDRLCAFYIYRNIGVINFVRLTFVSVAVQMIEDELELAAPVDEMLAGLLIEHLDKVHVCDTVNSLVIC